MDVTRCVDNIDLYALMFTKFGGACLPEGQPFPFACGHAAVVSRSFIGH